MDNKTYDINDLSQLRQGINGFLICNSAGQLFEPQPIDGHDLALLASEMSIPVDTLRDVIDLAQKMKKRHDAVIALNGMITPSSIDRWDIPSPNFVQRALDSISSLIDLGL